MFTHIMHMEIAKAIIFSNKKFTFLSSKKNNIQNKVSDFRQVVFIFYLVKELKKKSQLIKKLLLNLTLIS